LLFKHVIEESSQKKESNIILALDLPPTESDVLLHKALMILDAVEDQICAVKFNRHLVLPLGLFAGVQKLLKRVNEYGLPTIMDCKINDVGSTNKIIAEHYYKAGFNALTANPFVGWKEGMQPVFEIAKQYDRGVILLVFMSHEGSSEGYGQEVFVEKTGLPTFQYEIFAQKALEWGADGVVVGATYPKRIEGVHSILGKSVPIYSPGVGAQGGKIEDAVRGGARYLIVGRSITMTKDPLQAAKSLKIAAQKAIYSL